MSTSAQILTAQDLLFLAWVVGFLVVGCGLIVATGRAERWLARRAARRLRGDC